MTIRRTWAASAIPADLSEPPFGVRDSGYQFEDALPHDELNKILKDLYELGDRGGEFENVPDLLVDGVAGRQYIMHRPLSGSEFPFKEENTTTLTDMVAEDCRAIATNGTHVVVASETKIGVFDCSTLGWSALTSAPRFSTLPGTPTDVTAIAVGRTTYAVGYNAAAGRVLGIFSLADDTLLGSYTHSASGAISAVVAYGTNSGDETYVLTGTASTIDSNTTRMIDETGAAVWSMTRGAAGLVATTDGYRIFTGGGAGTGGATIEELHPLTGAVIELQASAAPDGGGGFVTDGQMIYYTSGGTDLYSTSCNLAYSAFPRFPALGAGTKRLALAGDTIFMSLFAGNQVFWFNQTVPGEEFGILQSLPHAAPVGVCVIDNMVVWLGEDAAAPGIAIYHFDGKPRRVRIASESAGTFRGGPNAVINYIRS